MNGIDWRLKARLKRSLALIVLVHALAGIASAQVVSQYKGGKSFGRPAQEQSDDDGAVAARGIRPSGLVASFAAEASCVPIASPFASATRHDGSARPGFRFGGLHGGIDLSLDEGTPLRSIAAGTIVNLGAGGQFEGIYLWLQHAPEDTGLPFWLYSKYQHLRELPGLAIGEKVPVGQVVGVSGRTGTAGPAYGPMGYPHLHLTTVAGRSGKFERQGSRIVADGARMFDPLAVYLRGLDDVDGIDRLPDERKTVAIPYVAEDGSIRPAGSRVVWPVGCKSK